MPPKKMKEASLIEAALSPKTTLAHDHNPDENDDKADHNHATDDNDDSSKKKRKIIARKMHNHNSPDDLVPSTPKPAPVLVGKPKSVKTKKSKADMVKGAWSEEEDALLKRLVEEKGALKWAAISLELKVRSGKQCRERWHNHLCPGVNKTPWTLDEEKEIVRLHRELGNKWAEIAKHISGRTDNSIKNHWNSTLKNRVTEDYQLLPTVVKRGRKRKAETNETITPKPSKKSKALKDPKSPKEKKEKVSKKPKGTAKIGRPRKNQKGGEFDEFGQSKKEDEDVNEDEDEEDGLDKEEDGEEEEDEEEDDGDDDEEDEDSDDGRGPGSEGSKREPGDLASDDSDNEDQPERDLLEAAAQQLASLKKSVGMRRTGETNMAEDSLISPLRSPPAYQGPEEFRELPRASDPAFDLLSLSPTGPQQGFLSLLSPMVSHDKLMSPMPKVARTLNFDTPHSLPLKNQDGGEAFLPDWKADNSPPSKESLTLASPISVRKTRNSARETPNRDIFEPWSPEHVPAFSSPLFSPPGNNFSGGIFSPSPTPKTKKFLKNNPKPAVCIPFNSEELQELDDLSKRDERLLSPIAEKSHPESPSPLRTKVLRMDSLEG